MSKPALRVAVTGAAGQIGYALLFRIASGEMLGKDQPVILQLLEIPDEKAQKALKGVIMELDDCAFPLLQEVTAHSDPRTAFKDADVALLVGARPRGPGMERKDLLSVNAQIFTAQGKACLLYTSPRLIVQIAPAVAQAAADSGVAARPIEDIEAYRQKLMGFVYHSGQLMRPLFAQAKKAPKRVIYADGEDERVLRAVQTVADEKLAFPILIGRPSVIEMRIKKFGLRLVAGQHFEIVDPEDDSRFNETWTAYYQLKGREGVTPAIAKAMIRKHNTLIGAMLLRRGDADALLCGVASK